MEIRWKSGFGLELLTFTDTNYIVIDTAHFKS